MNQYLLRIWGKDKEAILALRQPEAIEPSGPLCYWFNTPTEREVFIASFPPQCWVMRDSVDPEEGIDTHAHTVALVTLRLPDGRVGMFEQNFGFGYPDDGVHHMWEEGNYSCDCNRRLFLARECGIDTEFDDLDMAQCG